MKCVLEVRLRARSIVMSSKETDMPQYSIVLNESVI